MQARGGFLWRRRNMGNIKVECPHCGKLVWARDERNVPCPLCGKIIITTK
jgi:ribosomal protein S27E